MYAVDSPSAELSEGITSALFGVLNLTAAQILQGH